MTLAMVFQMADWFPSEVTIGDQRFFGSEILILVIQKYLARAMLIAWPILTAIVIFLEFDYRKNLLTRVSNNGPIRYYAEAMKAMTERD